MLGYFSYNLNKYWQSKRKKTYTSLGLSLLLILVFSVFALRPTLLTVIELREKLAQGKKANAALDQKIQLLSLAQANYEKTKEQLIFLDEALPKQAKILDFLNKVDYIAKKNELLVLKAQSQSQTTNLESTTKNPTEKDSQPAKGGAVSLPFSFEAQGLYPNLRAFVNDLQNFERLVDISEVNISKIKDADRLELKLGGVIYFYE